ncbi:MAG: serine/threonine protein kinase [Gemmataceae bacterium]
MSNVTSPLVGQVFLGRYEVLRLLGQGGMGRVYLARQRDLDRMVVIKVMHDHIAADPRFRERFQRETLLLARFQHPYAVALYDASLNDPAGSCMVMEYVRGVGLDQLLARNGRFSPVRVGRLLGQLCEVLQAAHSQGIIHRDLKPANLMIVDPDTPYEKIKVMDFGLAKDPNPNLKALTDAQGEYVMGTPGYICPEPIRGEPMDHRGDIYSVGVVLFELLTGRLPFEGDSAMDIMLAHATEEPPTFAEVGAADWVPPVIEEVVRDCLAKNPNDRPQSARDLAERYETALAHEEHRLEEELPPEHPRAVEQAARTTPTLPSFANDPHAIIHHLEAWMPEQIAAYKLRGFVQDVGGEVVQNVPGMIRVRLGQRTSWFHFGRRSVPIDMELHLQQAESQRGTLLHITVLMRPLYHVKAIDDYFRKRCDQIFCELRAYLMGY